MGMIRVQCRIYNSFECLRFHWTSIVINIFGSLSFMTFPIFLLWTFLKHGVLNMPAGHVVVVAKRIARSFTLQMSSFKEARASEARASEARAGVLLEMNSL